jgi:hypothetical protein
MSRLKTLFTGRTGKLLAGVFTTVLLLPVPALGFTILQPWAFTPVFTNPGAPAPVPSVTDTGTNGTQLTVDMGIAPPLSTGPTAAISFFTATRRIRIDSVNPSIRSNFDYETFLQGASLRFFVFLRPVGTNTIIPFGTNLTGPSKVAGIRFGTLAQDAQSFNFLNLASGDYDIVVQIRHQKNRFGMWDNSLPRPGSPYRFGFFTI